MITSLSHRFAAGAIVFAIAAATHADVVGTDSFGTDGAIAGQTGGTGFAYEQTDEAGAPASTSSDYEGNATVAGGVLVTDNTNAFREYNGATEGVTFPSNEREGAFRGTGVVYWRFDLTRTEGNAGGAANWGGLSSFDFGTERMFFGVPGGQGANPNFGIASGVSASTGIEALDNVTYRIVAAIDFDNDEVRMWVNPGNTDYDQRGTADTADASAVYTANNWATRFRLASGADANTEWDNLVVSTTFARAVAPDNVFADDFNEANGTLVNGKAPDVGGNWSVTVGSAGLDVQSGEVDTAGGARAAFGTFTEALSTGRTLVLDFETADTTGLFHSNGFAGISLFEGGTERIFIGDPGGASSVWGLRQSGLSDDTTVADESVVGKFLYAFDTGAYQLFLNGVLEANGTIASGFALDRVRFANGDGGDINVSELVVSFEIPAPAALPAGLALIGLAAARRRRRG